MLSYLLHTVLVSDLVHILYNVGTYLIHVICTVHHCPPSLTISPFCPSPFPPFFRAPLFLPSPTPSLPLPPLLSCPLCFPFFILFYLFTPLSSPPATCLCMGYHAAYSSNPPCQNIIDSSRIFYLIPGGGGGGIGQKQNNLQLISMIIVSAYPHIPAYPRYL